MFLLGRSLVNMYQAAKATGYWQTDITPSQKNTLGSLPPEKIMILATGSQGEEEAALYRLAFGKFPGVRLNKNDVVIFSSRVIPGNEESVEYIRNRLSYLGVKCFTGETMKIHASGHPSRDELMEMYKLIGPELVIPVHGTPKHLDANGELAETKVNLRSLVGLNGDLFKIAPRAEMIEDYIEAGREKIIQSRSSRNSRRNKKR